MSTATRRETRPTTKPATELEEEDRQILKKLVGEFAAYFGYDAEEILKHKFIKLFSLWLRPYGKIYAH